MNIENHNISLDSPLFRHKSICEIKCHAVATHQNIGQSEATPYDLNPLPYIMPYNKKELEAALAAIISMINKCEKVSPKLKEGSAQATLLKNRIKALHIASSLITEEMNQ